MAWAKVDDSLTFHPKVLQAGNEAMGVWVRTMAWSMQQLTDGFIPLKIVVAIEGAPIAPALVSAGLWHEVEGGYQFNDWCNYQPSREQVMGERAKTAERQAKWREKKEVNNASSNAVSNGVSNGVTNSAPTRPDPTRISISKEIDRGRATRIPAEFQLTKTMAEWAAEKKLTINIETETEKFANYYGSIGGSKALRLDWTKTWCNWMLKAQDFVPAGKAVDPWAGKEHLGFAE